jgi:hypothetical protein
MIYISGCERWVTIKEYVRAIKIAKANPDARFKHTLCSWGPGTGRDIMREFMHGLHDRINQALPYLGRGVHLEDARDGAE